MSDLTRREMANLRAALEQAAREVGDAAGRESVISTLLDDYDLLQVCADACVHAHLAGAEERVAFCLVGLLQKHNAVTSYGLEVGTEDFASRLAEWASTIADHLRTWGHTYTQIQDEALGFGVTTISHLLRQRSPDDVLDTTADFVIEVLLRGPTLQEMTLDTASAWHLAGDEYLFQSPLPKWVETIARRRRPSVLATVDISELDDQLPADQHGEALDPGVELFGEFAAQINALLDLRASPEDIIVHAQRLEEEVSQVEVVDPAATTLLNRVRAELVYVADELRREHRAFDSMLVYILLAMASRPKLQAVALSRLGAGDPHLREQVRERLRSIIGRQAAPTPTLIAKSRAADSLSHRRLSTLEQAERDAAARAGLYQQAARLLEELPTGAHDVLSMAQALDMSVRSFSTAFSEIVRELEAVDRDVGRAFRRCSDLTEGERASQRYLATGDAIAAWLADEIAKEAIERTRSIEELLAMLRGRPADLRLRAAAQIAGLDEIGPGLAAALTTAALRDPDARVRAASNAALAAHDLPTLDPSDTEPLVQRFASTETAAGQLVMPFYIVCDVSQSMSADIPAINMALQELRAALSSQPTVEDVALISILSFSDTSRVVVPLGRASDHAFPPLATEGGTNYGAAFRRLAETIDADRTALRDVGAKMYRPAVLFLTDGQPQDASWLDTFNATLTYDPESGTGMRAYPVFLPLGLRDAEEEVLGQLAYPPSRGRWFLAKDAKDADAVTSLLNIVTSSILTSSQSAAAGLGGGLRLPLNAIAAGVVSGGSSRAGDALG